MPCIHLRRAIEGSSREMLAELDLGLDETAPGWSANLPYAITEDCPLERSRPGRITEMPDQFTSRAQRAKAVFDLVRCFEDTSGIANF